MKRQNARKSKSFSSLHPTASATPQQFRELGQPANSLRYPKSKAEMREGSFSDSDSSDSSCFDKKFYRCGCLSGCHHHYRDYLAELRAARLRRQEKAASTRQMEMERLDSLSLSETEKSEAEAEVDEVCTPKKPPLARIAEINESAQYSKRKSLNSITISLHGKKYYRTFTSKEEVLKCFGLLEQLLK